MLLGTGPGLAPFLPLFSLPLFWKAYPRGLFAPWQLSASAKRHSCSLPPPALFLRSSRNLSARRAHRTLGTRHLPLRSHPWSKRVPVREAVFLVFNATIPPALPAIQFRAAAFEIFLSISSPRHPPVYLSRDSTIG